MTSPLSERITRAIHEQDLTPIPKSHFLIRRALLWALFTLLAAACAFAIGAALLVALSTQWSLASRFPFGHLGLAWYSSLLIFIPALLIAVLLALLVFRATRHGYRYSITAILIALLCATGIAGTALLATPIPQLMHTTRQHLLPLPLRHFHAPEKGYISGDITALYQDTAYLTAADGTLFEVWLFEDYLLPPDTPVIIFGELIDSTTFAALGISPLPETHFLQQTPR